jgi:hypothetical protein
MPKFVYSHLFDGVHADHHLQERWYHVMCQSIAADICERAVYVSSSDDDDDQMDTWDFKRNKLI